MGSKRRQHLPSLSKLHRYPIHHQRHSCYEIMGAMFSNWGLMCSPALSPAPFTWKHPKYRRLPQPKVALYFPETQSQSGSESVYCFSLVSTQCNLGTEWIIDAHSCQFTVHIQSPHAPHPEDVSWWAETHLPPSSVPLAIREFQQAPSSLKVHLF